MVHGVVVDTGTNAREGARATVAGGKEVGFAALIAIPDETYRVDDILCGNEVAFGEFGVDDGVYLKRGYVRLDYGQHPPTLLYLPLSLRGLSEGSAHSEKAVFCVLWPGYLFVMVEVVFMERSSRGR